MTPQISICETCTGNDPLLADMEDLGAVCGVSVKLRDCMSRCSQGPNCVVKPGRSALESLAERKAERKRSKSRDRRRRSKSRDRRRRRRGDSEDEDSDAPKKGRNRRGREDDDDDILSSGRGGGKQVVSGSRSFERSLQLLKLALGAAPQLPEAVVRRARLRSDALRKMCSSRPEELAKAELLLTEAIQLELDGETIMPCEASDAPRLRVVPKSSRLVELRMLRGELRGSRELARFSDAVADFDDVLSVEPSFASAYLEKAKVLRRSRRTSDALESLRLAVKLGEQPEPPSGHGLPVHARRWAERIATQLEQRLLEERVVGGDAAFSGADASDSGVTDSGSGGGWWKVSKIVGLSRDSCVYHLRNHPPATPHPCPHDAWHVRACFGEDWREYTPVSTVAEWEQGLIKLLVKTYSGGRVSERFAKLRPAGSYADLDEQPCWVLLSVPVLTLNLRQLRPSMLDPHIALVVGGTGVAPALQILRAICESVDGEGALEGCSATLLYSSHMPDDVLLLDELRSLPARTPSGGKILVRHTLTRFAGDSQAAKPAVDPLAALNALEATFDSTTSGRASPPAVSGRHHYFASKWTPPAPLAGGPLRTDASIASVAEGSEGVDVQVEAPYRGRPSEADILAAVLPRPSSAVRVVVCGPPMMWEDVSSALRSLGFAAESLVELKALSSRGAAAAAAAPAVPT